MGIDSPCCTWSRARRDPKHSPFPCAVRSNGALMGLPDLEGRDKSLVRKHNFMFRQMITWVRQHASLGGSGYLEDPLTPMLWRTRAVRWLSGTPGFVVIHFDMCRYNCAWRKPTRLLCWGAWTSSLQLKSCSGLKGICSRTHRPHVTLSGVAIGRFRTLAAQVCPSALTAVSAEAFFR